jgi:hypothetical protein
MGRPSTGRRAATVLALVSAVALAGCTSKSGPQVPSPTSSAGPTTTASGGGAVKQVIRGLVDRQGEPNKDMVSVVHAYVVKVNWADLQPAPFGPIAPDNAIDRAIARVRQPDFAAVGMVLKLRVLAGIGAPEWVKSLGGSPIKYINNQPGGSVAGGTIGRFWTADFGRAYDDLQTKLAAKYDGVPEIRELTVSRCSTIFDELFVRQPGDASNVSGLLAGGYTQAADQQCIAAAIKAHDVWKHTTSDVDFSPFPNVTNPSAAPDLSFTESVMKVCRAMLGIRCGLQNNALSTDKLANPNFQSMYAAMKALGPPIMLQTAAQKRLGDEQQVVAAAVRIGANSMELPAGYPRWPMELLTSAAKALAANPLPAGEAQP